MNPMTTKEVTDKNYTESDTCSVRCVWCKERVWFTGSLCDQENIFVCPYCRGKQLNPNLGRDTLS